MDAIKLDDYIEYLKISKETMSQDLSNFLDSNIRALEMTKEDMNKLSFILVSLLQMNGGKITLPKEIVQKNSEILYSLKFTIEDENVTIELETFEEKNEPA